MNDTSPTDPTAKPADGGPRASDTVGAVVHEGGCLCGAVRWRTHGPLRAIFACHCTQCRRTSGHFWATTSAPLDRFAFTCDDGLAWYRSSAEAERGFCRQCGSALFWKPADEPRIAIAAGSFDGPTGLETAAHIFCAFKGDYYDLPTDVPLYPESD